MTAQGRLSGLPPCQSRSHETAVKCIFFVVAQKIVCFMEKAQKRVGEDAMCCHYHDVAGVLFFQMALA